MTHNALTEDDHRDYGEQDIEEDEEYEEEEHDEGDDSESESTKFILVQWGTSTTIPELRPAPRCGHVAVFHSEGDVMLVHGGYHDKESESNYLDCLFGLDLKDHQWKEYRCTGQIPAGREGHTGCLWRNRLYIFGGRTANEDAFDVHMCDLKTLRWEKIDCQFGDERQAGDSVGSSCSHAAFSTMRWSHSMAQWGHYVYVYAGVPSGDEVVYNDVVRFDLNTHRWEVVGTGGSEGGPQPRYLHSAVVIGNEMIVHGGTDANSEDLSDTWILKLHREVGKHRWEKGPSSGVARCAHGACADPKHKLMYIHGGTSCGDEFFDTLSVYDAVTRTWENINCQKGPAPESRARHTLVNVGDRMYVFGGMDGYQWMHDFTYMSLDPSGIEEIMRKRKKYLDRNAESCDVNTCGGEEDGDSTMRQHSTCQSEECEMMAPPCMSHGNTPHSYFGQNTQGVDDFFAVPPSQRNSSIMTSTTTNATLTGAGENSVRQPSSSLSSRQQTQPVLPPQAQPASNTTSNNNSRNPNTPTKSSPTPQPQEHPPPPPHHRRVGSIGTQTDNIPNASTTVSNTNTSPHHPRQQQQQPTLQDVMRLLLSLQDRLDAHEREFRHRLDDTNRRVDHVGDVAQQRIREIRDVLYNNILQDRHTH